MAEVGHDRNTIWYAFPEIKEVTGLSLPEASREFQRMSVRMFMEHPLRYAVSVANAWIDFWTVPILWDLDGLEPDWLRPPLRLIWWVEHKLLRLANACFVLLLFTVIVSRQLRQRLRWDLNLTSIAAMILFSSLIQALADQGASSRYAVTIQALVVLVLIVAWQRFRETSVSKPSALREGSVALGSQ
jgi:hypothetical protein